jgi:hypothetical protein
MQSHYQFNVSVFLALGLGVTLTLVLSPTDAVGYPSAAVSLGQNPVLAMAGEVSDGSVVSLFSPEEGTDFVVTDVVLTMGRNTWTTCHSTVTLSLASDGRYVGRFSLQADGNNISYNGAGTNHAQVSHSFTSGILVPSGDTLQLSASACEVVNYTLSGYYAQP